MGRFYFFSPSQPSTAAYYDKAWALVLKKVRYGFATHTDFQLHPLAYNNVITVQIRLTSIPSFTDQKHIIIFNQLDPRQIITKQFYLIFSMKKTSCT